MVHTYSSASRNHIHKVTISLGPDPTFPILVWSDYKIDSLIKNPRQFEFRIYTEKLQNYRSHSATQVQKHSNGKSLPAYYLFQIGSNYRLKLVTANS